MPLTANFDEVPSIKYFEGVPRQYRFNASTGILNIKGITPVTKKGQAFTILPVAYRQFRDNILNMGVKNWIEFFFLNKRHEICSLLLHGYSVENLSNLVADLFYEEAKLYEIALTIKPSQKENKSLKSKYYICEFEFEKLDTDKVEVLQSAVSPFKIYRNDTLTGEADNKLLFNYHSPLSQISA